MLHKTILMAAKKNITLVAHDNKKDELLAWAQFNRKLLAEHSLYSTGTTGSILTSELGLDVTNRASADFVFSSALMSRTYDPLVPDYERYRVQPVPSRIERMSRLLQLRNGQGLEPRGL